MTDLSGGRGWLNAAAAASIHRIDSQIGHRLQITEAGRTRAQQQAHWDRYQRYLNGGPWAPIAARPGYSLHESGWAIDSDEAQNFVQRMADNGWIRTVYRNGKLVEPWHFEYSTSRDKYLNSGGSGIPGEGDEFMEEVKELWQRWLPGKSGVKHAGDLYLVFADAVAKIKSIATNVTTAKIASAVWSTRVKRGTGAGIEALQELADAKTQGITANGKLDALSKKLDELLKRPTSSVALTDAQVAQMADKIGQAVALAIAPQVLDLMAERLKD